MKILASIADILVAIVITIIWAIIVVMSLVIHLVDKFVYHRKKGAVISLRMR
ncbi:MAG: hypothetical protein J6X45_01510 [Lachnospiraceae bacterium]|nr:hypothetical protein [Lachnospiraceae bacterium]